MRGGVFILAAMLVAPGSAQAARVVLFPLEAKEATPEVGRRASQAILRGLLDVETLNALDSAAVSKEHGIDLAKQAKDCQQDVLCLVQIGEVIGADKLLLGHVRRDASGGLELRLTLIDVQRATLADTLRWEIPPREGALEDAGFAAGRQLLIPPDAQIVLEVSPKDADVYFYGQRVGRKPYGEPMPYWSGVYYAKATAEGHEPKELRVQIPVRGPTRLPIALEVDPLWTGSKKRGAGDGRRLGSGIGADVAGAAEGSDDRRSAFANPIAWAITGAGAAAAVSGIVLMSIAQGDYNDVSGEVRYTLDQTRSWSEAVEVRRNARDQYSLGSKIAFIGAGVGVAALGWMAVDALISAGGGEPRTNAGDSAGLGRIDISPGGVSWEVAF